MMNISDHDVMRTNEEVNEASYNEKYPRFAQAYGGGKDNYPIGSIFLSLRRGRLVKSEFAGKSFTKTFEEIVLSPDGRVGVLEKVRCTRIREIVSDLK